jgi:hypothetical protein
MEAGEDLAPQGFGSTILIEEFLKSLCIYWLHDWEGGDNEGYGN